jgi:hypothetical protein
MNSNDTPQIPLSITYFLIISVSALLGIGPSATVTAANSFSKPSMAALGLRLLSSGFYVNKLHMGIPSQETKEPL